jgi:hypothetical protein
MVISESITSLPGSICTAVIDYQYLEQFYECGLLGQVIQTLPKVVVPVIGANHHGQ